MQVVVTAPPPAASPISGRAALVNAAITGGSGGLGLLMAHWLAASGAVSSVHLFSRRGKLLLDAGMGEATAPKPAAQPTAASFAAGHPEAATPSMAASLLSSRISLVVHAADVGSSADLQDVLQPCGPYQLVLHAAGVLSDALLPKQSLASLRTVRTCTPAHITCSTQNEAVSASLNHAKSTRTSRTCC